MQAKGAKRQYMEVARSLKLYGYLVFRPAICDYPEPHTRATLALGRAALNMRLYTPTGEIKEIVFKVSYSFDSKSLFVIGKYFFPRIRFRNRL